MEFLMQNKDNNLNNCYSYSLDGHLRNGEKSCNMPISSFFFHNISKGNNREVPFMIPRNIRKKFENFTRYINSKEHTLLNATMNHWNEMSSGCSEFLTAPKGYSDVSNSIASYLIGGFVGSKSQMNNEKHKLSYDLGSAIFKMLHDCKYDKPYDKLREEKKFETHKYGKKPKSSTKENNECFQDVVFCNNLINKNNDIKTNGNAITSDWLIEKNIPTLTVTEVQEKIDENCPEAMIKQVECDKTFTTESVDGEEINEVSHMDTDSKCLNTSFVEPADSTEEQISSCLNNEEQSVANHDKDATLTNSNNGLLENDEKSDADVLMSVTPVIGWSLGVRRRQYSECSVESTDSDSFIVFDDKCCLGPPISILQESDLDESDFSFEEDDSDGIQDGEDEECCWIESNDECDAGVEEREVAEANARWSQLYKDISKDDGECERRVRFKDKVTIHRMVAWDYAYRAARPGPWEQFAHDRGRFKERIQRLSAVISPILLEDHRKLVYNKLYA